jgi:hypothetical protein
MQEALAIMPAFFHSQGDKNNIHLCALARLEQAKQTLLAVSNHTISVIVKPELLQTLNQFSRVLPFSRTKKSPPVEGF